MLMIQQTQIIVYEDSINWLHYGVLILSGVVAYALACFLVRRRDAVATGVEREYQPPQPDIEAFVAVAITDAVIRFITMQLTKFFFLAMSDGAIPLELAPIVGACRLVVFALCSYIVVMLISKALLPTTLGRAAFISILKVMLQFTLASSFYVLLNMFRLL